MVLGHAAVSDFSSAMGRQAIPHSSREGGDLELQDQVALTFGSILFCLWGRGAGNYYYFFAGGAGDYLKEVF